MKRSTILNIAFLLAVAFGFAQENFKQSLNGIKKVEIETNTRVWVVIGSSNEIELSNGANCDGCEDSKKDYDNYNNNYNYNNDNDDEDDRAKGLTPIYSGGTDNTGFGMYMERDGDVLRLKDLKSWMQRGGFTVSLPRSVDLKLDCGSLGSAWVNGLSSDLEVNTSTGSIMLKDVTGPITAHSSTSTIDVVFSTVNQGAPISISSSTGHVDVSLPSNTNADVELKSTMGEVYSNFDLEVPREDGLRVVGGRRNIKGKLGSGGVKISLRSSTGNVYLRKN